MTIVKLKNKSQCSNKEYWAVGVIFCFCFCLSENNISRFRFWFHIIYNKLKILVIAHSRGMVIDNRRQRFDDQLLSIVFVASKINNFFVASKIYQHFCFNYFSTKTWKQTRVGEILEYDSIFYHFEVKNFILSYNN